MTIRVVEHTGPRSQLRSLFELAEDSAQQLGFRMRAIERDAFTPETGYDPGLEIDGIALLDRVWLDRGID